MKIPTWICTLISFLWIAPLYAADTSVLIHDAAFSPDGKIIGVATDSELQLLDSLTTEVVASFPFQEGVKFIKWMPDNNRILLASWQEPSPPTYSMLDLEQDRILFSFQDEIRWYITQYVGISFISPDGFSYDSSTSIFPNSTILGHAGGLTFSPDGNELAYITNAGLIRIRDAYTGDLLHEFSVSDYNATSLGYTPDQQRLWVGITINRLITETDYIRFLYLDNKNGQILERMKINQKDNRDYFSVFNINFDQKYALIVSSLSVVDTAYSLQNLMYVADLEKGEIIGTIAGSTFTQGYGRHRATFNADNHLYILNESEEGWFVRIYDYTTNTTHYTYDPPDPWDDPPPPLARLPVPVQPFSPVDPFFLMIKGDNLLIVNWSDLTTRTVHINIADVQDYPQHEQNLYPMEKQNED